MAPTLWTPLRDRENGLNNAHLLFPESATCATVSCKSGQKCLVEKKTGRPRCVTCNLPCPEPETLTGRRKDTSGPVCGSNDKTYHSWCHMFMDACATGLVIETKASGPCQDVETGTYLVYSLFTANFFLREKKLYSNSPVVRFMFIRQPYTLLNQRYRATVKIEKVLLFSNRMINFKI